MHANFRPITISDVAKALDALTDIERPDGDNEGDSINSADVYKILSPEDQDLVDHAENIVGDYLRNNTQRAITELHKHGYTASFNPSQYDSSRNVGQVEVGDWSLDVSDASNEDNDF